MSQTLNARTAKFRRPSTRLATVKAAYTFPDRWGNLLYGVLFLLAVACGWAGMDLQNWRHREQLADRETALVAAHYSRYWFSVDRLPEVADDPRAGRELVSTIDEFVAIHKLPCHSIWSFLHRLPYPQDLPIGTTVVNPHVESVPPATVIELAVHDADGQFLEGLTRVDFELFQNEQRLRRVAVARAVRQSADQSVVVLLDCSTSMKGTPLQTAKEVATDFVEGIAGSTRMQIWMFSDKATALTPWTSEGEILTQAIQNLTAQGNTTLYAGMQSAILSLSQRPGHRSLVILTDGEDSTKTILPAAIIALARQHQVELHLVGLLSGKIDASVLRSFAEQSNGSFHTAADGTGLTTAFGLIAEKLREPVYRLVILDPVSTDAPLILRLDGLADVTLRP